MRTSYNRLVVPCAVVFLALSAVAAWSMTVPNVMTPSSFLAVAGLLAGCVWVTVTGYINGRPVSSLAQSLHDAHAAEAADRVRRIR